MKKRALLAKLLKEKASKNVASYPASDGQRALFFVHTVSPESYAYHIAFSIQIHTKVDVSVLHRAAQFITDRFATLRTTYALRDNDLVQNVHEWQEVAFEQIDATSWSEGELFQQVTAVFQQSFDLVAGPVARWHLFDCGRSEYVFLFCVHHIAIDAWSLEILLSDLRIVLQEFSNGRQPNLPPLRRQYVDWAKWQAEMLASNEGKRLQAFWKEQLVGELPALNLTPDFPRPTEQTYSGASISFTLPAETTGRIKALAQSEGVTLYMLLLAAFQTLLYRYTRQDQILVGTPTSGRNQSVFNGVVGYFVNPVVLNGRLGGNPSFQELLVRTRHTVIAALENQDYPFLRMVQDLDTRPSAGRSPIFQCMFNLLKYRSSDLTASLAMNIEEAQIEFGGMQASSYPLRQQEGQFELTLDVVDSGDRLFFILNYLTDLFHRETIAGLMQSFEVLLDGVLKFPSTSIARLPILTSEEHEKILVDWNQTQSVYPRELCTHQLFEAQVLRTPVQPAVKHEKNTLTYRQLNQRANQLAHHLISLGIAKEQLVGVYLERSIDMVVAVLGVMKSGGAYVPMDPMFPPQRIGYMIEDSRMPVIITQQSLADTLPPHDAQLVVIDTLAPQLALLPDTNNTTPIDPKSLAYVIFTSGSTGRPKGVEITHRSLVNFLTSMQEHPGIQSADVLASVTTLSFDIAGLELYLPIVSGACLVVLSADTAADGSALAEALERYDVTILQATPATWRLLVETGWRGRSGFKILCGGEPLSSQLANELLGKGGELWNMYGPTETTIWSTIDLVRSSDRIVSIGRPIANTETYILDDHLQPVPVGVTGTLYIGGDGLARGYLHQPELTDEKFVPHPFASQGRIYNTGDLARYLPDGRIVCLGRSDSQVKIRGFRIELGEVEAVLSQHTGIKQAVVVVREDTPGDRRLVAYYISQSTIPARELRTFVREKLPPYMVPSAYVFLESFPLTPNGKVNRKALPAPTQGGGDAHKNLQPPTTPTEQIIAETWMKVLNLNQVGVFDNFFDLGGHSLLAMQVVAEIQKKTGFRIEPAYLRFESLGQLAVTLEEKMQGGPS
jgi:amino acid adenylation domain-containing protein